MLENDNTDLALELIENEENVEGVIINENEYEDGRIKVSIIQIINDNGVRKLGRPIGNYITIEGLSLLDGDEDICEPFSDILHWELMKLINNAKKIFVIGLGNRNVTPDALGPMVVDNLCITRHLLKEGIIRNKIEISAISPGVMAQTGIESLFILKALCDEVKPDVVLAIDSLAANEVGRLNTTIQICDTGINPGAGVGNNRLKLCEETLGIKVIAIGVPTVISMSCILDGIADKSKMDKLHGMFVTPKNIDEAVKRVSYTISEAINRLIFD